MVVLPSFGTSCLILLSSPRGFLPSTARVLPEFPFFQNASTGGKASYAPLSDKAVEGINQIGVFSDPERWEFDWERKYTRDEWLETVPTFGGHSQIPPEKLNELLSGIGRVVDAAGGSITINYTALVITATRTGPDDAQRMS